MSLLPYRHHENRPWGSFDRFTQNEPSTVKILKLEAGKRLSLQKHAHRAEFWHVVTGTGSAEIDGKEHRLRPGSEVEIPIGSLHRLTGGPDGIEVLEVAIGDFDEHDIERVADDFGRAPSTRA